jgi:hypothetical protein
VTTVAVAPVGLTRTLFAVYPCPLRTPKCPGWPGSEVSAPSPSPQRSTLRGILSQALAPLQSITDAPPYTARFPTLAGKSHRAPLPRFFPLQRFASRVEPLNPRELPPHGLELRPWAFSTLRRFAPHTTCRAYFIPDPLMGFSLRGLAPPGTPYVFSDAVTLTRLDNDVNAASPPQGFARPGDPAHEPWGLAKDPAGCPLGIVPLRGFLPDPPDARPLIERPEPSRAFSTLPQADRPAGAPGHKTERMQPFSLETGATPLRLLTFLTFLALRCPAVLGYEFPSETVLRRRRPHLLFARCRASCRSSPRKPLR